MDEIIKINDLAFYINSSKNTYHLYYKCLCIATFVIYHDDSVHAIIRGNENKVLTTSAKKLIKYFCQNILQKPLDVKLEIGTIVFNE